MYSMSEEQANKNVTEENIFVVSINKQLYRENEPSKSFYAEPPQQQQSAPHCTESQENNNMSLSAQQLISEMMEKSLNISESNEGAKEKYVHPKEHEADTLQTSLYRENFNEINMADFDATFDSVASLMEVSMNVSSRKDEGEPKELQQSKPTHNFATTANVNPQKLTVSQAAGVLAIAEDSNFESEDMFADFEEAKQNLDETNGSCTSNEVFDASSELEDSTFTRRSVSTVKRNSLKLQNLLSRPSLYLPNNNDLSSTLFTEIIGGGIIKVKKVMAVEFLPENLFQTQRPLGIGLKITVPKPVISTSRSGIGANVVRPQLASLPVKGVNQSEKLIQHSVALYNGGDEIWVIECKSREKEKDNRLNPLSNVEAIFCVFEKIRKTGCAIVLLDAKETLKKLIKYFGKRILEHLPSPMKIWDPKIAQWLWHFEDESWNITTSDMMAEHLAKEDQQVSTCKWGKEIVDSYIACKLMSALHEKLVDTSLWKHFVETEMPSVQFLMLMEMNGLKLDYSELERQKNILQYKSALLELRAFQLANRQFNLASSREISQILFREIGLKPPSNTKGTGKDVLRRLDHELPKLIIEWRKISSAIQRIIIPFQQDRNMKTGRVHGLYSHFTVTGRVIMSEPSVQCIPRDFDLTVHFDENQIEEIKNNSRIRFGTKLNSLIRSAESGRENLKKIREVSNQSSNSTLMWNDTISLRNAFVPCTKDFAIVSADYSQLELRILAHLCQDKSLLRVLNQKHGDVFISLAAGWKGISPQKVNAQMRQETKGLVYGIIYGMGQKTLSEHMDVSEDQAALYIKEFMQTYPGVRTFLDKTVKECRERGFIETISGRKRYLRLINSRNINERAQAERQAVNSRISGSASDLVKIAMTKIHRRFNKVFPLSLDPIDWRNSSLRDLQQNNKSVIPEETVCFPILNLHDELMFEVRTSHLNHVATEIRSTMESCVNLLVHLPVVIKSGNTWGSLQPLQ